MWKKKKTVKMDDGCVSGQYKIRQGQITRKDLDRAKDTVRSLVGGLGAEAILHLGMSAGERSHMGTENISGQHPKGREY